MQRQITVELLSLVVFSFAVMGMGAKSPPISSESQPTTGAASVAVAPQPRVAQVFLMHPYAGGPTVVKGATDMGTNVGIVTGIGNKSINVAFGEAKISRLVPVPGQGDVEIVTVIPAQPSRLFIAIGPLANGEYLEHGTPAAQYRLSDVKVGDKVFLDWWRFEGADYIHYVRIERRPGGKVPPSPAEKPDEKNPWHEKANAYQELEEKGTPLPEKFRPKPLPPPPRPLPPSVPR